jgi:hypothetical protein
LFEFMFRKQVTDNKMFTGNYTLAPTFTFCFISCYSWVSNSCLSLGLRQQNIVKQRMHSVQLHVRKASGMTMSECYNRHAMCMSTYFYITELDMTLATVETNNAIYRERQEWDWSGCNHYMHGIASEVDGS